MEHNIVISILLFIVGSVPHEQTITQRLMPVWFHERFENLGLDQTYELGAYLQPLFLEADFNGDEKEDVAATLINSGNRKIGLLIIFKDSNIYYVIGVGNDFGPGGEDYKWADYWEVFNQSVTHETIFLDNGDIDGTRNIPLEHAAISVREDEGSGGLVYYDGFEFVWIHQGD